MKIFKTFNLLLIVINILLFNNFICAQIPVGSGNFSNIPIEVETIKLSQCGFNDAKIIITSPLGTNYKYGLNGGPLQVSPIFDNLQHGIYNINYIDENLGCTSIIKSVEIEDNNAGISATLVASKTDQTNCNPKNSSINISSPLGSDFEYRINNGSFQSSPIFENLDPGDYTVEYRNINSGCVHPNTVQLKVNGFPCEQNPEFLCKTISNFKGIVISPNSFSLNAPDNFSQILAQSYFSSEGINHQLSFVKELQLQLDYLDNNQPASKIFNILSESMFGPSGTLNLNIDSWSVLVENVATQNFTGSYTLIIHLQDGSIHNCTPVNLTLNNEVVTDPDNPNNFPDLPVLDCNTNLPFGDISISTPKQSIAKGEIIFIQAFPIKVSEISAPSPDGIYTGLGIMPLPFGSKNVLIEFTNVTINVLGVITNGSVSVVRTEPTPNIVNPGPLQIGGDICLPPPPPPSVSGSGGVNPATGLDPYGFNPTTGLHSNNTAYDDNGFDINGNYRDTQPPSPYNPNGCDRNGWSNDTPPQPCDPTLQPNPPLPIVTEFLNQNGGAIDIDIVTILNQMKDDALQKLNALGCNNIKTEVINLKNTLNYNSNFITGSQDQYVTIPELVENFQSPISKSDTDIGGKDITVKELENKHVDLYQCAIKAKKYQLIIDIINDILNDQSKLAACKDAIKAKIEKWTSEEAGKYIGTQNKSAFDIWLLDNLKIHVEFLANYQGLFTNVRTNKINFYKKDIELDYIDHYNSIASLSSHFTNIKNDEKNELEFYFNQDFQTIKGIDRAFYLEAMSQNISISDIANNVHTLPVTVKKQVGNFILTLILDKIRVTTATGILDAYIIVEDSETGRKIVFKGLEINFGTSGTVGTNKLFLGNNVEIRINNAAKLILNGNPDTYVEFNCKGFSGMGIDAQVEFCRNFILPLDENLNVLAEPNRYRLALKTKMKGWLDFDLEVDASNFALAKYEDIKFTLSKMTIDLNSSESPNIPFPQGYQNAMAGSPGWKGFYTQSIEVVFPNEFSSSSTAAKAGINDLIIDGSGVTAAGFYDGTILSLADGNIGGWGMSIEYLEIKILQNHFSNFFIKGQLETPLFGEPFNYEANVYANKVYKFKVIPKSNLTCDLLLADAELTAGSNIEIGYDSQGFGIKATFNGKMKIKGISGVNIKVPEMEFNGMELSNRKPYFTGGNWTLPGSVGAEFKGFELNVEKPRMYQPDPDIDESAGLLLRVRLAFEQGMSIAVEGDIGVDGEMVMIGNKQKWKYKTIQVHKFCIGGSFPGVKKISGCIDFFNESESNGYGNGFKGGISVEFESFLKEIKAIGQFGKIGNQRYFFVDASASLQTGIPLGPISLNGFSGGLSYHMSYTFDPRNLTFEDSAPLPSELGVGLSGMTYTPNFNIGIGLSAGAMFSISNADEVFNGSFLIKAQFYAGGGLDKMSLTGLGQFISPMNLNLPIVNPAKKNSSKPQEVSSVLSGYVHLEYIPGKFSGDVEAFLVAGGGIEGAGDGGKLVDVDLEFTSGAWHIYYGLPVNGKKCGIKYGSFGTVEAYLCMGSVLPDFPELPDNVRELAPLVKSNSSLRAGGGGGLLFGASFNVEASLNVLGIVSGSAKAGGGFDVMLRKYNNTVCEGTTTQIGWNGWYAAGQAWAYIEGELSVLGYNVIKAGIAAILQARLPNPSWVQGTLGVKVESFLGDFDYDMKVEFGETCNFVSIDPNNPLGMDVIASTEPINNAVDIPVDQPIKIYFNLPINKEVGIKTLNGESKKYTAKIKAIDGLSLKYGEFDIDVEQVWSKDFTELLVRPAYFLPTETDHQLKIVVEVYENGNKIATEEKVISFKTGGELKRISEANIVASYPINEMKNFYIGEQETEYIYLNQGLYDLLLNENFNVALKLNGQTIPVTISDFARKIEFDISSSLSPSTTYKLDLVRYPKAESAVGQNGNGNPDQTSVLYSILFRTSKYNKFSDKVAYLNNGSSSISPINSNYTSRKVDEPFDDLEIKGNSKYSPLVNGDAQLGSGVYSYLNSVLLGFPYIDENIETYCGVTKPFDYKLLSSPKLVFFDKYEVILGAKSVNDISTQVATMCKPCIDQIFTILSPDEEFSLISTNPFYKAGLGLGKDGIGNDYTYKISYNIPQNNKSSKTVSVNTLNK